MPPHRWRRSIQVDRLPSHSQGYCSTHERPGTWRSSPQDQYWSLILSLTLKGREVQKPAGLSGGLQGAQGPPGASSSPPAFLGPSRPAQASGTWGFRGLQAFQKGAGRGVKPPGPPGSSTVQLRPPKAKVSDKTVKGLQEFQKSLAGPFRPAGASSRASGACRSLSFKLSRLPTYANEEVLLLTKMDLTEFRS